MFETEIAVNQYQRQVLDKLLADLPDSQWYTPGAGHGHPPVWIVGHLAYVGEFGQKLLGAEPTHPEWSKLFGIGSSDNIAPADGLDRATLTLALHANYTRLYELCRSADTADVVGGHGLELFRGTPLETRQRLLAHVLTSHFGFHSAQLSSCRREAGQPALI